MTAKARARPPAWKEADERDRRRLTNRVRARRRKARRYAVVYDIDGPRVRLGIAWFAINVVALAVGRGALAPLYALVAARAAQETSKAWRARGQRPHPLAAAASAGVVALAAAVSTAMFGAAVLVLAAAAVLAARARPSRRPWVVDAGYTVQCSLFAGLAAGGLLTAARYELGGAVALVLLVSAYETGDYLVGSGASNSLEGPLAGILAMAVITFCIAVLAIPPFDSPGTLAFGALAACLCPLGQLAASAVLPSASARAPALRRLDSLLVLAPVWAWSVGLYVRR